MSTELRHSDPQVPESSTPHGTRDLKQAAQNVEPDSEVRRLLKDREQSNLRKYMWLTLGEFSLPRLFYYEALTMLLAGLRGALGIFLRQRFYPGLFQECGSGVVFGHNLTIRNARRIKIGDNVVIDDNVVLDGKGEADTTISIASDSIVGRNSILVCKGGTIEVKAAVNISVNCTIISESQISIGEKSLVAGHCYIIAGGNHGTEFDGVPFVDQPRQQHGGVRILQNCWLGAHSTVLDGNTIGPDTIVGAAALVNRDAPPRTIVAGVPAVIISAEGGEVPFRRIAR